MKKFQFMTFAMMIMALVCVGFTSCSNDDDDFSIVGTWMEIDSDENVYIYLYSNGAGKYTEKGKSNTFTYTYDDDSKVLTITVNGRTSSTVITIISNDKIIVKGDTYMRIG